MASVYEDWSDDRGGVDVSIVEWWWPDFLIFTRCGRTHAAHSSKLTIQCHPLRSRTTARRGERERERSVYHLRVYVAY